MFWINWPFGGKDVTSSPTPSRNCLVARRDMKKSGLPFYNRNLSHALFSEELFTLFSSASTTPCSFDLHNYPVQQSCSQTICYGFVPDIPAWLNQTNSVIESTLFFFFTLIFYTAPSSCRGNYRPEGAGLPEGPRRAELIEVRRWPNIWPRPLVWVSRSFSNAGGEGQHDGAEPTEQPGNDSGAFLHQSAQSHDWPGSLQPTLHRPDGRWWVVWPELHQRKLHTELMLNHNSQPLLCQPSL